MKRIPEQVIQDILARTAIDRIIGDFIRLERKGGRLWGLCPFHQEKSPSFSVDPDKNFFYCFGCHKGGNAITFLMDAERMTYPEAIEFLAEKTGITIQYEQSGGEQREEIAKRDLSDLYERVTGVFSHFLSSKEEGKKAQEYLKSRGLTEETIRVFRLGWSPENRYWLHAFLKKKGFSEEFLSKTALFSAKYPTSSFFSARIMFPIKSIRGEIIAFGGRTLGDGPKYLNSPESPIFHKGSVLFALFEAIPEIKTTKTAIICEGYMDAIALHQAGIKNTVAPLGTAFSGEQASLLARWADRLILFLDADEAGQNAAKKSLILCAKAGIVALVSVPDGGKDASEILEKEGPEKLREMLAKAINSEEYLVKRVQKNYNISTIEGKYRAAEWLYDYAQALNSEVRRQAFFEFCSNNLGIEISSMSADFNKRKSDDVVRRPARDGERSVAIAMDKELSFLMAVTANRDHFPRVRAKVKPDDFINPFARDVFIALEESFRHEDAGFADFIARIDDESLRTFVMKKSLSDEFRENVEKTIDDGLKMIAISSLERKRDKLSIELKKGTIDGIHATRSIDELMYEKMFIDSELLKLKEARE